MKKFIITPLSLLISIVLWAQNITINHSEEYTNEFQEGYWTSVLGQDETGYYFIRKFGSISSESIILEKYSLNMELIYAENVESTSGSMGDSKLHRLTEFNNGKVYVFLEGWNKEKQENSFLIKEVGPDGKVVDSEIVLETEYGKSQMKAAIYSVSFSDDGSKLLVLTQKPFEKNTKESIRLQVFNTADFSSIWHQDIELSNESERAPKNYIRVNNQGVAYIFKDIQHSWKSHTYMLITASGSQFVEKEIELNNYQLGQHKLNIDADGNLLVGATISLIGKKETDFVGTWIVKVNPKGKFLQNTAKPLGAEILSSVVSENKAKKEDFALTDYILKDILINNNDEIIFLVEEFKTNKTVVGQSAPPVYDHTLSYGNVLIIAYNDKGERLWHVAIDKKQKETTRDQRCHYGSFAYTLSGNRLYIVWNFMDLKTDPPLNKFRYWIDRNGNKINVDNLYGEEALYPTLVTVINEKGDFVYNERTFNALPLESIQKGNSFRMAFVPAFFVPLPDGLIIMSHMSGIDAKRYKFSKLSFLN